MRRIITAVLVLGILGSCSGCLRKNHGIRVIEQISAQWEEGGTTVCHTYDEPEKMQLILNKVRTLGQRFSSDIDPETLNVPTVTMIFSYSDGRQQQYQIKPDRYVRIGDASWQQASPKNVTSLRLLLMSLPEDHHT